MVYMHVYISPVSGVWCTCMCTCQHFDLLILRHMLDLVMALSSEHALSQCQNILLCTAPWYFRWS